MTETDPNIIFTISQEIGLSKFEKFLRSPEKIFLLKGKAGTGKTTLISEALKEYLLHDKYTQDNLYVMGVTVAHRAKEMLRFSIPYVNTFASVFGHRESTDEHGNKSFKMDKRAMENADCNKKWKVVVFDECSMINNYMLKMISNLLHPNCKIIFMGDRGQLPPIEEELEFSLKTVDPNKDSPVFDMVLPEFCQHELTERVRQTEGNPIIDLSDIIYEEIFRNHDVWKVMKHLEIARLENDMGHRTIDPREMYEVFTNISKDNYLDTKLIAYRRATVKDYNKFLRNYIHYDPISEYIEGEIIYMNGNYYHNDNNYSYRVNNSSEHIIRSVENSELDGIPIHLVGIDNNIFLPSLQGPRNSVSMEMYRERLEEYRSVKDWENYWNFKDSVFADFSYGYCLTAYKAQGSTYTNAFVEAKDILAVKKITPKRKLQALYTAITRARENVFFIQ